MHDFVTVFVVTDVPKATIGELMVAGCIALAIGFILVGIHIKLKDPKLIIDTAPEQFVFVEIFFILFGLVSIGASLVGNAYHNERRDELVRIYQTQQYKVVEGIIQVISIQPASGHAPGDLIRINGVEFEINYYSGDLGYSTSIAHNGVLTEGKYVRVYYHDGEILRIDLKQ